MGVDENASSGKEIGAGDQGLMFGYACNDTAELMPMPIAISHRITNRLTQARYAAEVDWLRPDSKSQVTIEYDGFRPVRVDTVVVSTQHSPSVSQETIKQFVIEQVVKGCLPPELVQGDIKYYINPTGKFVVGGPHGDCGLTGRKIIVDTYGGWGRHGGGAFSGKDPTKVDRSAAYMARHVAKCLVAAGLADRCELQLAYAIGVTEPVSVHVDTQGSGKVDDAKICEWVRELFPLSPGGIIDYLKLRRPIYRATSAGGHFGRNEPEFTWECTDAKASELKKVRLIGRAGCGWPGGAYAFSTISKSPCPFIFGRLQASHRSPSAGHRLASAMAATAVLQPRSPPVGWFFGRSLAGRAASQQG